MFHARRTLTILAILTATPWLATAQEAGKADGKKDKPPEAANRNRLKASGVIVKLDEADKDGKKHRTITVNTAVVWRDWVRDQAPAGADSKSAEKGADSVATKGQPQSPDTLVTVDLAHDAHVESVFRASDDENSDSKTREKALEKEQGNAKDKPSKGKKAKASDLKTGLFVDVEFRARGDRKTAHHVVIVKPAGGPNTPDSAGGAKIEVKKVEK